MKNGKLGVCIIGCGFMGGIHAERWNQLPQAEIVAVVDILEDRASKFSQLYHLEEFYTDYHLAACLPEVDIVSICVPTCLHAEMTVFSMEQGKHVLCEKPIALNMEQAQSMLAASEQYPVQLGIGFMRRHSPVMDTLRALFASSEIVHPVIYHASDIRQVRPKLAMHDAFQNGGPVVDMAVHLIDTWRYIFQSEPVQVFAQGLTLAKGRPELEQVGNLAIDSAVITVTFASGDIGNFNVSWGLPPGVNPPGNPDHIYSPSGLVELTWSMNHQSLRLLQEGGEWKTLVESDEDPYQKQISTFADCILEEKKFPATAQDGIHALRVAQAALQSIKTGKAVYLT